MLVILVHYVNNHDTIISLKNKYSSREDKIWTGYLPKNGSFPALNYTVLNIIAYYLPAITLTE